MPGGRREVRAAGGLSCRHGIEAGGECYGISGFQSRRLRMQMAPWFPRCLSGVWMEEIARPACSGTLGLPKRKRLC